MGRDNISAKAIIKLAAELCALIKGAAVETSRKPRKPKSSDSPEPARIIPKCVAQSVSAKSIQTTESKVVQFSDVGSRSQHRPRDSFPPDEPMTRNQLAISFIGMSDHLQLKKICLLIEKSILTSYCTTQSEQVCETWQIG